VHLKAYKFAQDTCIKKLTMKEFLGGLCPLDLLVHSLCTSFHTDDPLTLDPLDAIT